MKKIKSVLMVAAIIISTSIVSCKKEEIKPCKSKTYKEIHDLHKSKLRS